MAGPLETEVFEMIESGVQGTELNLRSIVEGSVTASGAEHMMFLTEVLLTLVDAVLRVAAEVDRSRGT